MLSRAMKQTGSLKAVKKALNLSASIMKGDDRIVAEIQSIRAQNNATWMDILRTALKYAPGVTRALLGEIVKNDQKISVLTARLVGEGIKKKKKSTGGDPYSPKGNCL